MSVPGCEACKNSAKKKNVEMPEFAFSRQYLAVVWRDCDKALQKNMQKCAYQTSIIQNWPSDINYSADWPTNNYLYSCIQAL